MICSLGSFCSELHYFSKKCFIGCNMNCHTPHILKRNLFNLHFYQDSIKSSFSIKPLFFPAKMKKVKLPLDLIYKCVCITAVFVFTQYFVTVKVNLEKTVENKIKNMPDLVYFLPTSFLLCVAQVHITNRK